MQNKKEKKLQKQSDDEQIVCLRVKKKIVELVDKERTKFSAPRSSWIIQAVVEKLEKLGYEIT